MTTPAVRAYIHPYCKEVMTVRKLALVGAIAALWLFVAAATAFADGGPHTMATNNGSAGLTADTCASCHRAHTAKAASLLNADQPDICLNCHDGSKATTDVMDGIQYSATAKTGPVLGALRGGGFQYALIGSSTAAKMVVNNTTHSYNSHVSPLATGAAITSTHGGTGGILAAGWGTGTVWGNGAVGSGTGATVTLECASCHNPHGNGQYRILQTTPSLTATSGTFTVSIASGVQITDTSTTGTHNYTIKPASDAYNQNGSAANIVTTLNGDYWRYHWDPTGATSWTTATAPKDQMNTGWSSTSATNAAAYGTASTTLATGAGATDKCIQVASSTGFPAVTFFVKIDSEYLSVTKMSPTASCTGWTVTRGEGGSTAAAHSLGATIALTAFDEQGPNGLALMNTTGLMTAWCVQCHTRYEGPLDATGSPSSLSNLNSTSDPANFDYKHGTTRAGCEQCHVSHGSNALMTGTNSVSYTDPNGVVPPKVTLSASVTSGDSRLLKADNRGTCQLCHDPTGTITNGTYIGPDGAGGTYVGPLAGAPAGTVPGN